MKKSVKILCLVMTIALTLTSLPITAFALPLASNEKVSYETNDISQYISEDVYVMAEATEKRGEFEKHYILSDGSMVAVSYPEAVHYINESGKWEDIDNTFSYDSKSKRYVGGKGNTKISFTESVSSGALVAIKDKHGTMEWSLGIIRNNKAEKGELSSTKAKVGEKTISEKATYSLNETETFDLPKTVGRIQYDTLFTNSPEISVDYSVYHNKIEEDIYINSPTDLTSFTMDVQIGDLCGIVNKDGSVEFKNEAGEVIYRIGVPYMHDSADSVLNDITVTLDQAGDTCTVTYTPNSEWLNSEDRAYPILFDPSITTSEYNSNITDTYVMQGDTANHSSQQTMYVGVKSGSVCRTYIKIGTLPAIDPSMPILSATMTLSLWASSSSGKTVGIYKANSSWSADTITYATQPNSTQLATCAFNASDLHYTFNLSNDVSEVYDEFLAGANYGYMLRYLDESTTDPDYNSMYSSEYTTKSYRPVLKIVYGYALPENLQSGSTYSLQNAGSASFVTVCDGIDANATNVVQKYNEIADITTNQQFKLEYVSSTGGYLFRALCSSNGTNRVLDIAKNNGYVESGCNVQIYQNNDSIAQEWLIVGVDWDTFKIVPRTNMNLALTSYASFDDGSSDGTTASSTGNIFVSTYDEDNSYQRWYIIENGEYIEYESDSDKIVQNATYYFNNLSSGQYMRNDGTSSVKTESGMISYLSDSIRWKITYVGNGYCTIQSTYDLTQYLGRTTGYAIGYVDCTSTNNVPNSCLWTIERAYGGGVHISFVYNTKKYYVTQSSANIVVAGTAITSLSTWRMASTDFYGNTSDCSFVELQRDFSVDDISILVSEYAIPTIIKNPSNALWCSASDFTYTIVLNAGAGYVEHNDSSNIFFAIGEGTVQVMAKHKVTGWTSYFDIIVNILEIVIPCSYATSTEYTWVNSFPVYVSYYIDEYSDFLNGVTWQAFENDVITFDAVDMTVQGYSTGLAWLEAQKNGMTLCRCYVYVEDIYKDLDLNIRNSLYKNGLTIGTVSINEYNEDPSVDPLLLRLEWYLHAVELFHDGADRDEIRESLETTFGLRFGDSDAGDNAFEQFMFDVEHVGNGFFSRENLRLSFDGAYFLLNFFWSQYAYYALVSLDTVNVYTPATVQGVAKDAEDAKELTKEIYESIDKIDDALTNINYSNKSMISADNHNVSFISNGQNAPYTPKTAIYKVTLTEDAQFFRAFDISAGNKCRSWLALPSDMQGLTAQQIRDKFVLTYIPTHYCIVNVPAGTELYVGLINNSSVPGSIQYELVEHLAEIYFGAEFVLP
jgi:hypothetical protein